MHFRTLTVCLVGCLGLGAVNRTVAQSSGAAEVKAAAGSFLNTAFFTRLNMYKGRRVLLDTTRLAWMYDGGELLRVESRPQGPRGKTESSRLATSTGVAIAGKEDLVRCTHEMFGCTPDDVAILKMGDPVIQGDSAFVVYQITWTPNGERRISQQLLTLYRSGTQWQPSMIRALDGEKVGVSLPIPGLVKH